MIYTKAKYLMGATKLEQLPKNDGIEVAFAGRSNAGKSSALNTLTGHKSLARVSKTPGRTQLINVFTFAKGRSLIDLPGYGYARVAKDIKKVWQKEMEHYITERLNLKGIVLLADPRHNLKEFDCMMINMAVAFNMPMHILLTKSDKLKNKERTKATKELQSRLATYKFTDNISYQLFSAKSKSGLTKLQEKLDEWFEDGLDDENSNQEDK